MEIEWQPEVCNSMTWWLLVVVNIAWNVMCVNNRNNQNNHHNNYGKNMGVTWPNAFAVNAAQTLLPERRWTFVRLNGSHLKWQKGFKKMYCVCACVRECVFLLCFYLAFLPLSRGRWGKRWEGDGGEMTRGQRLFVSESNRSWPHRAA